MQIQLSRYVGPDAQLTASGLPEGADALAFTKAVRRDKKPALFIARDDARAAAFLSACRFFFCRYSCAVTPGMGLFAL